MLPALRAYPQTHSRNPFAGPQQVPCSLAPRLGLGFFRLRRGFSLRLRFSFGFRRRLGFDGIKNLFPNLALRLLPVLNCSTLLTALLFVELIGSLADLPCQVGT